MKLSNIKSEQNLRTWLSEQVSLYKLGDKNGIDLKWIEPSFGSSVGLPDAEITLPKHKVGVELKFFSYTKRGINWEIRPAQRRYHLTSMSKNIKSLVLFVYISANNPQLCVIRGDYLPHRIYVDDESSGIQGAARYFVLNSDLIPFTEGPSREFLSLMEFLTGTNAFWSFPVKKLEL